MSDKSSSTMSNWLLAGLVVVAIGAGAVAFMSMDPSGESGSGLPSHFDYDIDQFKHIDPALIGYREVQQIPLPLTQLKAIAAAPAGAADDRLAVVGDKSLLLLDASGAVQATVPLPIEPTAVCIAGPDHAHPGRIYVGLQDYVAIFDGTELRETWPAQSEKSLITSIAVGDNDVFVADAAERSVWHYNPQGTLIGRIGAKNPETGVEGFSVPSPYFDVAIAPDGLLRVVNPAFHRIEAYTFDGHRELMWGRPGMNIESFSGCCNPANIAIYPDGRVATAEKGLMRVKVNSAEGEFLSAVVGPDILAPNVSAIEETRENMRLHPVDLAIRADGALLVLDPQARAIRVYQPKREKPKP